MNQTLTISQKIILIVSSGRHFEIGSRQRHIKAFGGYVIAQFYDLLLTQARFSRPSAKRKEQRKGLSTLPLQTRPRVETAACFLGYLDYE